MTGIDNVRNYVDFGLLDRGQTTFANSAKKTWLRHMRCGQVAVG